MSKSLKTIENFAFADCPSLTSVTIPDSVTSIGYGAFIRSTALRQVKSLALVPPTLNHQDCFQVYDQARLIVPQEALAAYNTAQYWSLFNKTIAIERIGDVDGNGEISIADITILTDYLLSKDATGLSLDYADVNMDDNVDIADVTDLIDYLLNKSWD